MSEPRFTPKCSCRVERFDDITPHGSLRVVKCPLCRAAPSLYAASSDIVAMLNCNYDPATEAFKRGADKLRAALADARGRESEGGER